MRFERQVEAFLEHTSDAFYILDRSWRFLYVNRQAERLWDRNRRDLIGRVIWEAFPAATGTTAKAVHERAAETGRPVPFEYVSPVLTRWIEGTVYPVPDGGVAVYFRDVSARKRGEDRLRFLIEASEVLAGTLDSRETLRNVARLCVPFIADACIVDIVDDRGRAQRVAEAVVNEEVRQNLRERGALATNGLARPAAVNEVLRTGEPQCEDWLMAVPLNARGRRLGAITFLSAAPAGRRFDEGDLIFAQEVAARAALAVDNARLFEAAQEASQAKSNFMSVMSHELRTPLTAVIGYADLLDAGIAGALTPKQQEYLNRIRKGARLQLQIVEEVLTYARVEAGRAYPVIGRLDLWRLVRDTAALLKPSADVKRLEFHVDLPEDAAPIDSDASKLRQVVLNLLGNAVKFTRQGEISVRGWRENDGYFIEVSDTGIGIPPEHLDRIYEPFWQAEQATTRTYGGSGLGLAVAQRLLDLLGGQIAVTSAAESGTTFRVRVPIEPPRMRLQA